MNILEFHDYRLFFESFLKEKPKAGHGLLSQWAKSLRVSTTLLSQILKGKKSLSLELAEALALQIGLSEKEMEYLFLLVQYDRAGTASLKKRLKQKINEAQEASRSLKNRIQNAQKLNSEIKTQYYSSWIYSGVRNLAVCEGIHSLDQLAERLRLPRPLLSEIIDFLLKAALLTAQDKGWGPGVNSTYLSSDSPLVSKHHQNWRLKAMQKMEFQLPEDLFYTSPMSLSEEMARKLRKQLVDIIEELQKKAGPTPSEAVRCLSIDWFEY